MLRSRRFWKGRIFYLRLRDPGQRNCVTSHWFLAHQGETNLRKESNILWISLDSIVIQARPQVVVGRGTEKREHSAKDKNKSSLPMNGCH